MRWIPFILLTYVALLAQTTGGILLAVHTDSAGAVFPDLLAVMAVFIALNLRNQHEVVIGCWLLGMGLDLTSGGQGWAVGPMAIAYSAGGFVIFKLRETFFRDSIISQTFLSAIMALSAHVLYVTLQSILSFGSSSLALYGQQLLQACLLALYTAVAAPAVLSVMSKIERLFIAAASSKSARER